MRRRTTVVLVGGAVAAALALGGLFGGVLGEHRLAGPSAVAAPRVELESALSGFARGRGTAATVATLETELRAHPRDADRLASLGLAYQLRWRETGDPTFLPLSERALSRALALRPHDASVTLGLGNLALIRHDFRRALRLGHAARRLAPAAARPYGVLGDALLELGRYDEAFAAFDRMTALKPDVGLVRPRRVRARADGRPRRGRLGDAPRPRRGGRGPRADRVDARRAGEARAGLRQGGPRGTTRACGAHRLPRLRAGARAARPRGGRPRRARTGDGDRAPRRDRRPAPAARRAARGSPRPPRPHRGRPWTAAARCRDRASPPRERPARRPRGRGAPRRSRDRAAPHGGARTARPCRAAVHPWRRRPRLGARACGQLRRGRPLARPRAPARHPRRAPLLPPRLRGRVRRRPGGDARLVSPGAPARPELLRAMGAGRGTPRDDEPISGGREGPA